MEMDGNVTARSVTGTGSAKTKKTYYVMCLCTLVVHTTCLIVIRLLIMIFLSWIIYMFLNNIASAFGIAKSTKILCFADVGLLRSRRNLQTALHIKQT